MNIRFRGHTGRDLIDRRLLKPKVGDEVYFTRSADENQIYIVSQVGVNYYRIYKKGDERQFLYIANARDISKVLPKAESAQEVPPLVIPTTPTNQSS